MQTYFPYSQIISICNNIKQTISRHAYFGEWQICDSSGKTSADTSSKAIGELYY